MPKADSKKKGSSKSSKDKGPKKPRGAYMFFVAEARPKVMEEEPSLTFGEVGKKLGALWREMSDDDKQKYHDLAKDDKERYEKEKKAHDDDAGDEEDDDDE